MSKTFELPGSKEAYVIGTATRTRKMWKVNGTLGTRGKELDRQNRKYPPEVVVRAGSKNAVAT